MESEIFISFFLATLISFLGSLQPGLLNMGILYTGYHRSKSAAIRMAIGGVVPELIYSSIAIFLYLKAAEYIYIKEVLSFLFIPLLFLAGVYLYRKKAKEEASHSLKSNDFKNGFMIGLVNPLLIPFWLIWVQQVVQRGYIKLKNPSVQIAFVIGTAVGALLLLLMVAFFTVKYKEQLERTLKGKINKLLGIICIILAFVELVRLLIG
ncbi:MAG: LysE family transporter [Bacteroidetes bacterium]|nr:LysE family transporter [Bacteroidota bacterium]